MHDTRTPQQPQLCGRFAPVRQITSGQSLLKEERGSQERAATDPGNLDVLKPQDTNVQKNNVQKNNVRQRDADDYYDGFFLWAALVCSTAFLGVFVFFILYPAIKTLCGL